LNKRRGEVRPPHKVDRHNVLLRKRADKPVSMETAWHCLASKRLRMARAVVTAAAPSHPDRPPARAPEALTLRKSVPTIKRLPSAYPSMKIAKCRENRIAIIAQISDFLTTPMR